MDIFGSQCSSNCNIFLIRTSLFTISAVCTALSVHLSVVAKQLDRSSCHLVRR